MYDSIVLVINIEGAPSPILLRRYSASQSSWTHSRRAASSSESKSTSPPDGGSAAVELSCSGLRTGVGFLIGGDSIVAVPDIGPGSLNSRTDTNLQLALMATNLMRDSIHKDLETAEQEVNVVDLSQSEAYGDLKANN